MNAHTLRPTTVALCKATGTAAQARSVWDERHLIYSMCVALRDAAWRRLGPERILTELWCRDRPVLDALRAALADRTGDPAMHAVAQVLAASGFEDADIIGCLSAWDGVAYRWRGEGRSAASISQTLQQAGLPALDDLAHARIDGWLALPRTALGNASALCCSLFASSILYVSLTHNGFEPTHDELFARLCAEVRPPLPVQAVRQQIDREPRFEPVKADLRSAQGLVAEVPVYSDDGAHWVVHYRLDSRPQAFFARSLGSRMDDAAVRRHIDGLMEKRGLPQRVYRFETEAGSSDFALLVVAEHEGFDRLLRELSIPVAVDA